MYSSPGAAELGFDAGIYDSLRQLLPRIAADTVAAIIVEVPSYAGRLTGHMGENIQNAVQLGIGGFLTLTSRESDPQVPLAPVIDAAYSLGQGEARSDRAMDALLMAYRIGSRVAWREMAVVATEAGMSAETMAKFAELLFAYIDELSAASVAGHADQLSSSGRVRDRYLEDLTRQLLNGAPPDALTTSAERATWRLPTTLTAILVPISQQRAVMSRLGSGTLHLNDDLPGLDKTAGLAVLLACDVDDAGRAQLIRLLADRQSIVGPSKPWIQSRSSYLRAVRTWQLVADTTGPIDTEHHLASLVIGSDPEAVADLQRRVLAPLENLRPASAEKLAETLRSWLLHQGRRDDVAADLFVHAQTVRYRMGQLKELFGDSLNDPTTVLELTIALHDLPVRTTAE